MGDGKCSYWMGHTGTSITTTTTAVQEKGAATIYLYLSHSAFPYTWLSVSGFESSSPPRHLGNTSLRVAMFLKLLSAQAVWRLQVFELKDKNRHLQELCSGLMASNQE